MLCHIRNCKPHHPSLTSQSRQPKPKMTPKSSRFARFSRFSDLPTELQEAILQDCTGFAERIALSECNKHVRDIVRRHHTPKSAKDTIVKCASAFATSLVESANCYISWSGGPMYVDSACMDDVPAKIKKYVEKERRFMFRVNHSARDNEGIFFDVVDRTLAGFLNMMEAIARELDGTLVFCHNTHTYKVSVPTLDAKTRVRIKIVYCDHTDGFRDKVSCVVSGSRRT